MPTTTIRPHTEDPDTCPTCVTEGRAGWPVRYVEIDPGPMPAADTGGDSQSSDAWERQFHRRLPDGTYAVIEVAFYAAATPTGVAGMVRQTGYSLCNSPLTDRDERWADYTYDDLLTDATPDGDLALRLCTEFDPSTLDWNGLVGGHLPCVPVKDTDGRGGTTVSCRQHRSRTPGPARQGVTGRLARSFACDKGEGRVYLVDDAGADDGVGNPRLVDLAGLSLAVHAAAEAQARGLGYGGRLRAWLYTGSGVLVELEWGPVPHSPGPVAVPDGGGAAVVTRDYEVTGPAEAAPEGTRVRYLRTTVTVGGDA